MANQQLRQQSAKEMIVICAIILILYRFFAAAGIRRRHSRCRHYHYPPLIRETLQEPMILCCKFLQRGTRKIHH